MRHLLFFALLTSARAFFVYIPYSPSLTSCLPLRVAPLADGEATEGMPKSAPGYNPEDPICQIDMDKDGIIGPRDVAVYAWEKVVYDKLTWVMDNHYLGMSSSIIICGGALKEVLETAGEEGANGSHLGVALLSAGHFLHYFREFLKEALERKE